MRTSDHDIYCVGDAAGLPGALSGLWAVSSEQGKIAADNITGLIKSYNDVSIPPLQLKSPCIDLKYFGSLKENNHAESHTNGDLDNHRWKHIVVKDGIITGGVFVNSPQAASCAIFASRNKKHRLSKNRIDEIIAKEPLINLSFRPEREILC